MYNGSDQDSNSRDDKGMTDSGRDRRGVKLERSKKEVGHQSASTSGGLRYTIWYYKTGASWLS